MGDKPMTTTKDTDTKGTDSVRIVEQLYDQMHTMEVMLDDDPLQFGPKRLNNKIAELRNMLTELERIFNRSSKTLGEIKRQFRLVETKIALTKADLFANDPEVRAGRNVADREATASVKMAKLISQKMKLQCDIAEIEDLMTVVKAKRSDLRDTQSRLRDQIKLCHDEISLGSRWGDKKPTITLTPQVQPQSNKKGDLDDILDHLEDDFNMGTATNWQEEPKDQSEEQALPPISDPNKVEDFLNNLERTTITVGQSSDDTFDDIFSD